MRLWVENAGILCADVRNLERNKSLANRLQMWFCNAILELEVMGELEASFVSVYAAMHDAHELRQMIPRWMSKRVFGLLLPWRQWQLSLPARY